MKLRVAGVADGGALRLQRNSGGDTASGGGRCGFPLMPTLQLLVGDAATAASAQPGEAGAAAGQLPPGIAAVVWHDPMNNTFATNTLVAALPPFSDGWVREASLTDSRPCAYGCHALYRVRVAAYNGSQTLVSVRLVEVTLRHYLIHVSYRHYLPDKIRTTAEVLHVPIVPWWQTPSAPAPNGTSPNPSSSPDTAGIGSSSGNTDAALYGTTQSSSTANTPVTTTSTTTSGPWALQLLGDAAGPRPLTDQPPAAWSADALGSALPGAGCSRQWSFTLLLQVRAWR